MGEDPRYICPPCCSNAFCRIREISTKSPNSHQIFGEFKILNFTYLQWQLLCFLQEFYQPSLTYSMMENMRLADSRWYIHINGSWRSFSISENIFYWTNGLWTWSSSTSWLPVLAIINRYLTRGLFSYSFFLLLFLVNEERIVYCSAMFEMPMNAGRWTVMKPARK